jgi:hypothetical protein
MIGEYSTIYRVSFNLPSTIHHTPSTILLHYPHHISTTIYWYSPLLSSTACNTVYTLFTHTLSTYTPYTHCLHTVYTHCLHTVYTLFTYTLFTHCLHTVYTNTVYTLFTYTLSAYTLSAYTLSTHCLHTLYHLFMNRSNQTKPYPANFSALMKAYRTWTLN